jgi:hypothetical protein
VDRLNAPTPGPHGLAAFRFARSEGGLHPVEALSHAWDDLVPLLFRPFNARRWIKLSFVCLFLGGGTPTAAIHWALSILPGEIGVTDFFLRARHYIALNRGLIILAFVLGLGLVVTLLYLRSMLRFVLVEAVVKQEVSVRQSWKALRRFGHSYFFWLLGTLTVLGAAFTTIAVLTFPYLSSARRAGTHNLAVSLVLMGILAFIVSTGLMVGLFITLTDDLVVPLVYAERSSLPAAWRKVGKAMRADPTAFLLYIVLRLVVSVAVSVAILFFLFPVLVSLFSGVIIGAALVVLALRLVGLAWAWNPLTIFLGVSLLSLLTLLLFILLSVVGMPGQVFIQDYGVRFIGSRFPALGSLCRLPPATGELRGRQHLLPNP